MSTDDVIELGSSDEETEPAPKRSKPMPNAMVCIPRTLHNVTIKPAKPNPPGLPKGLLGKAITVKKVSSGKSQIDIKSSQNVSKSSQNVNKIPQNVNRSSPNIHRSSPNIHRSSPNLNRSSPNLNKNKINGKPAGQQLKPKIAYNPYSDRLQPVVVTNKPCSSNPTIGKPNLIIKTNQKLNLQYIKNPIKIQNPINLPPNITVKKTTSNRPIVMLNMKGNQQIMQNKPAVNDVLTVELDDDEAPAQCASPQWYLRPEEQSETPILEDENNKEPDETKLIEITIEDSPVKPIHNKRTHEVGAELAITIDDSPVKAAAEKNQIDSGSDNEDDGESAKVPQSKKKLEYPKEAEDNKTVEIEIEPVSISESKFSKLDDKNDDEIVTAIENENDPETEKETNATLPKETETEVKIDKPIEPSEPSEFHPVYQSFIDLCFQLENSEDMTKIVEKKIKGYYRQVPKEYTESEEFIDMVSSKILLMKAGPEKMYLYIKDIVDELNLQRKLAKSQPVVETKNEEMVQIEETVYDSKRRRQIRKLEKTIKKLHRAIQKLEQQEVDFDDEDDSVYILTERYKERMVRVYAKFCQLSSTKMPSEPRIQIDARPGHPSGPAKRLEKWINKKVPIGTPLPFPDFHDVLRCVRVANEEDRLNFNEAEIMEEARDLFTRCGKKLQRRRQENEWRLAASRIPPDVDPAEKNEELKQKLNENKKLAAQKETEIFNKFADRQNQLKLEAEEIGDKEAEESPVESEEEEANDEPDALENTEQRKDRLKRLLQEKSKKALEEKENHPSNDVPKNEENNTISATAIKEDEADNAIKADETVDAVKAGEDTAEAEVEDTAEAEVEDTVEAEVAAEAEAEYTAEAEVEDTVEAEVAAEAEAEYTAEAEAEYTAEAEAEYTAEAEVEDTAEAEVEDTAEAEFEDTAEAEVEDTAEAEVEDTAEAEAEDTQPEMKEEDEFLEMKEEDKQLETKEDESKTKENRETSKNRQNTIQVPTETFTLSDDSNELESDIDELHLLQKLHSPNAGSSTVDDSSDSDCQIAISDSLESSDDEKKNMSDASVISIENSSYSEDENSKIENTVAPNTDSVQYINDDSLPGKEIEIAVPAKENAMEIDIPSERVLPAPAQSNNDEYTEAVENILLASSEDDNSQEGATTECVNLRDDLISIDETVIGNVNNESVSPTIEENSPNNVVEVSPTQDDNVGDMASETNSDEPKEFIDNNGDDIAVEMNDESEERMDVDQDDNGTIELDTVSLDESIPTPPTEENS